MPPEGVDHIVHKEILSYEEIIRVVRVAAGLGVRKIRITGGEPLSRKNVQFLICEIRDIDGIDDIALTTNGILLEKYADELKECGLNRINVSLDSLKHTKYSDMTRGGDLDTVLRGIERASACGLTPLKINMVPVRGLNDDEILDFARITVKTPCHVRFIEFMPVSNNTFCKDRGLVPTDEVKRIVECLGDLTPVRLRKSGPARYFRLPGAEGVVGFISAMTHHFCNECNRLRLTPDGKLRPCLFSETEIDLKAPLRNDVPDRELERLLTLAIEAKPEGHALLNKAGCHRPMSRIGG